MTINLRELATSMNDFVFSTKIPSTGEIVNGKPYTIRDEFKMALENMAQAAAQMQQQQIPQ